MPIHPRRRSQDPESVSADAVRHLELEVQRLTSHIQSETALATQTMEAQGKLLEKHDRMLIGNSGEQPGIYVRLRELQEKADRSDRVLRGDGSDVHPGLETMVDRMRQRANDRAKHMTYMWTAISSIAGGLVLLAVKVIFHVGS